MLGLEREHISYMNVMTDQPWIIDKCLTDRYITERL